MRRFLLALGFAAALSVPAAAQYPAGPTNQSSLALIAPTVASPTDNSNRIATTAWINSFVNAGLPLANGKIYIGSAGGVATVQTMSGDATLVASGTLTLSTVNANVGAFGSATQCATITANAKGLISAASAATCTPGVGSITGLGTGVATALGVNIGSAGAPVLFNGAGGTPSAIALANGTGLPIATGVSGLGTGIATWLATPSSTNLRGALTDETGTGAAVFATSPTITTPVIVGVADGSSAAAGNVGEYLENVLASGSAVSVTTVTPKTIAQITLTAGDWDVSGMVNGVTTNASTSITGYAGSLSTTTNALDTNPGKFSQILSGAFVPGNSSTLGIPLPNMRFSVTGSTTVFLVAYMTFSVSTMSAYGIIRARRVR